MKNGEEYTNPLTSFANGTIIQKGLTKREYFAAMAMQGFMSNSAESENTVAHIRNILGLADDVNYVYKTHYPAFVAKVATIHADALLSELSKPAQQ